MNSLDVIDIDGGATTTITLIDADGLPSLVLLAIGLAGRSRRRR